MSNPISIGVSNPPSNTTNQTSVANQASTSTDLNAFMNTLQTILQAENVPGTTATSAMSSALNAGNAQAAAEYLAAALMQSLPVPGLEDGSDASDDTSATYGIGMDSDVTGLASLANPYSSSATPTLAATAYQTGAATNQTTPTSGSIDTAIRQSAVKYGVPANLVRAVIQQESGMDPTAVSSSGAMGLMQLMPGTAQDLGVTNAFDPSENVDGGTRYLAQLLHQFDGNQSLALAAYNAGPGAVSKYGGIPPYSQTQNYVQRVLQYANTFATEYGDAQAGR